MKVNALLVESYFSYLLWLLMLAKIIDFLIMMKKGEGNKFGKDQNLDLKSDTCIGSCDDNIVEIQYIYFL